MGQTLSEPVVDKVSSIPFILLPWPDNGKLQGGQCDIAETLKAQTDGIRCMRTTADTSTTSRNRTKAKMTASSSASAPCRAGG